MEFYAVDPNETHTLDLAVEHARFSLRTRERALLTARGAKSPDEKVIAALEDAVAQAKLVLETTKPGSGPVLTVGLIPGAKRHVLEALQGMLATEPDPQRRRELDYEWMTEVVRYAVRGHVNFKRKDGSDVPFETISIVIAGEAREVPTAKTVETYYHAGILGLLAILCWEPQHLGGDEKNG